MFLKFRFPKLEIQIQRMLRQSGYLGRKHRKYIWRFNLNILKGKKKRKKNSILVFIVGLPRAVLCWVTLRQAGPYEGYLFRSRN